MKVQAEISLYPLRTTSLSKPIEKFCRSLEESGCEVSPGAMSTRVSGETDTLFDALRRAFQAAADDGQIVMTLKISNACPDCEGTR